MSSLERSPLFRVSFIERFYCITYYEVMFSNLILSSLSIMHSVYIPRQEVKGAV